MFTKLANQSLIRLCCRCVDHNNNIHFSSLNNVLFKSKMLKNVNSDILSRNIYSSRVLNHNGAYDGDGKTTVAILNKEKMDCLMIDAYSPQGFRLNNNVLIFGPVAMFKKTVMQWDVGDVEDIHEESLSLFTLLEPKLDVLVLGIGDDDTKPINPKVIQFLRLKKINFEILTTDKAVGTFNFLNSENRVVAAGLIPPKSIDHDNAADTFYELQKRKDAYFDQSKRKGHWEHLYDQNLDEKSQIRLDEKLRGLEERRMRREEEKALRKKEKEEEDKDFDGHNHLDGRKGKTGK